MNIEEGKANLKLFSLTLADNKKFQCRVQIPGDDEGKLADTAVLVVLGDISTSFFFFSNGKWSVMIF